ncbi:hypothetical protein GVAV_001042 [Gurleya vavrai]
MGIYDFLNKLYELKYKTTNKFEISYGKKFLEHIIDLDNFKDFIECLNELIIMSNSTNRNKILNLPKFFKLSINFQIYCKISFSHEEIAFFADLFKNFEIISSIRTKQIKNFTIIKNNRKFLFILEAFIKDLILHEPNLKSVFLEYVGNCENVEFENFDKLQKLRTLQFPKFFDLKSNFLNSLSYVCKNNDTYREIKHKINLVDFLQKEIKKIDSNDAKLINLRKNIISLVGKNLNDLDIDELDLAKILPNLNQLKFIFSNQIDKSIEKQKQNIENKISDVYDFQNLCFKISPNMLNLFSTALNESEESKLLILCKNFFKDSNLSMIYALINKNSENFTLNYKQAITIQKTFFEKFDFFNCAREFYDKFFDFYLSNIIDAFNDCNIFYLTERNLASKTTNNQVIMNIINKHLNYKSLKNKSKEIFSIYKEKITEFITNDQIFIECKETSLEETKKFCKKFKVESFKKDFDSFFINKLEDYFKVFDLSSKIYSYNKELSRFLQTQFQNNSTLVDQQAKLFEFIQDLKFQYIKESENTLEEIGFFLNELYDKLRENTDQIDENKVIKEFILDNFLMKIEINATELYCNLLSELYVKETSLIETNLTKFDYFVNLMRNTLPNITYQIVKQDDLYIVIRNNDKNNKTLGINFDQKSMIKSLVDISKILLKQIQIDFINFDQNLNKKLITYQNDLNHSYLKLILYSKDFQNKQVYHYKDFLCSFIEFSELTNDFYVFRNMLSKPLDLFLFEKLNSDFYSEKHFIESVNLLNAFCVNDNVLLQFKNRILENFEDNLKQLKSFQANQNADISFDALCKILKFLLITANKNYDKFVNDFMEKKIEFLPNDEKTKIKIENFDILNLLKIKQEHDYEYKIDYDKMIGSSKDVFLQKNQSFLETKKNNIEIEISNIENNLEINKKNYQPPGNSINYEKNLKIILDKLEKLGIVPTEKQSEPAEPTEPTEPTEHTKYQEFLYATKTFLECYILKYKEMLNLFKTEYFFDYSSLKEFYNGNLLAKNISETLSLDKKQDKINSLLRFLKDNVNIVYNKKSEINSKFIEANSILRSIDFYIKEFTIIEEKLLEDISLSEKLNFLNNKLEYLSKNDNSIDSIWSAKTKILSKLNQNSRINIEVYSRLIKFLETASGIFPNKLEEDKILNQFQKITSDVKSIHAIATNPKYLAVFLEIFFGTENHEDSKKPKKSFDKRFNELKKN